MLPSFHCYYYHHYDLVIFSTHNPTNIYLFKVAIETLEESVKYIQR